MLNDFYIITCKLKAEICSFMKYQLILIFETYCQTHQIKSIPILILILNLWEIETIES